MIFSPRNAKGIHDLVKGRVQEDVPLSRFTSFKIGGPADLVVEPADVDELAALLRFVSEKEIPRVLLGSGTNVLFPDEGFRGVVIRMASITGFSVLQNGSDHARISVAAGVPLPAVVNRACGGGWSGIEPLQGIPGSFGGAIVSNAGAGGVSVGDFIRQVILLRCSGEETVLGKDDLHFEYRSMKLPEDAVVVKGTLRLRRGERESIEAGLEKARQRRLSQPTGRSSAGCVFKNPAPDRPAGAIIDRLGFKGTTVGDAQVSEAHANFIINRGNAKATDVMALIEKIRARVKETEDIDLELEIRVMGGEQENVQQTP